MSASPRVVVVGEALVDVVPGDDGAPRDLPGGSPANVAVTLGRLGQEPTLVTTLAPDGRGAALREWLAASHVEVVATVPASGRTSTATVVLDAHGGATYEFDLTWDLPPGALAAAEQADVVHAGSISTVLDPGAATVEAVLRAARGRALVSFDPNARPQITPDVEAVRSRVERLVGLSDLVKVSEEDLGWYHPGADPVDVARAWCRGSGGGPVLVVVTLGADGAVLVRGDDVVRVPGARAQVVDTIGAGDTFMGALLDALVGQGAAGPRAREVLTGLEEERLAEAASFAARAAAVTVSRPGADPPTRAEITG
ncbi:carbohydrate kinase [Xylanimonas oleitrophica]|uniref:Carbohydrate kinase n=1 Tax=Xylanimonas oleitrophica TaxID=2607479 RepID=A0A2W5XR73_9MICO|nr:PfkB family carbohydrate kinase [Xylanimonas oleitrophica]PZR52118.1 carbohydrate kinase [Xylanimonas oleitrophica]